MGEVAPALETVGAALGVAAAVLGVVALVPPLEELEVVALGLGGLSFLAHYGAKAGEAGSFTEPWHDRRTWFEAGALACGAGAFAAGVKLERVTEAAQKAEQGGGALRKVTWVHRPTPQHPTWVYQKEMPLRTFQIAKRMAAGKEYHMGESEFAWRATRFHAAWSGNIGAVVQVPEMLGAEGAESARELDRVAERQGVSAAPRRADP